MTRSLVLPLLLISLTIGGFLSVRQSKVDGPASTAVRQAATQAQREAASTDFDAALPALQAWFTDHGTYAGVTLPPAAAVTVVRADAASYCLQSGTLHLDGPGGAARPGAC